MANKNGNERLGGRALAWRVGHMRSQYGVLPNLFFTVDRSWLVSALWDDAWTCVGGTDGLIDRLRSWPHGASARAGFLTATDPATRHASWGPWATRRRQEGADRGSRITTAVSDDRSAA